MPDTSGLTAFERRRAENAKVNNEILNSISKTSAKVFGDAKPKKPRASPSSTTTRSTRSTRSRDASVKRDSPQRHMPTRRSARVAGIDADPELLKRKLEVDNAEAEEKARQKRLRVSGDLQLDDLQVEGDRWQGSLAGLQGLHGLRVGAQPGVRTFDEDAEETSDATIKELRKEMNELKLYETFEVKDLKLTKERIYALTFHPTEDKPIVIAGDKEGRLGIFDASQQPDIPVKEEDAEDEDDQDPPGPVIVGLKPHARTISSVYVLDTDPNAVYTASYDTTIRKLDLAQQKSIEVYAPSSSEYANGGDHAISCLDFPSDNPHLVYFSTLQGTLGRHDLRARRHTSNTATDLWPRLHDGHKIGGFSLSPRQPHLVATASLDRTVKIWDLRKMVPVEDEDDKDTKIKIPSLLVSDPSRLSVSHADWSPGGHLATTSYDDTIRIYDLTSAGSWKPGKALDDTQIEHLQQHATIPHNNQTGRWVSILKPRWQRHPPGGVDRFVVGNMNRFVDIYAAAGEGAQLGQLDGDGITAVPAVAQFHPSKNWVAGGNASGKLTLWM